MNLEQEHKEVMIKKIDTYERAHALYEGRGLTLNTFKSGIFPIIATQRHINTLTIKQMLRRLPIALAQVNAVNTSQNLLNEIRQIIYYFYRTN